MWRGTADAGAQDRDRDRAGVLSCRLGGRKGLQVMIYHRHARLRPSGGGSYLV